MYRHLSLHLTAVLALAACTSDTRQPLDGTDSGPSGPLDTGFDDSAFETLTVARIRAGEVRINAVVKVEGLTVSGVGPDGFHAQESGATNAGIYVLTGTDAPLVPDVGDRVDVVGRFQSVYGLEQLQPYETDPVTGSHLGRIVVTGSGVQPAPVQVDPSQLLDPAIAESLESMRLLVVGSELYVESLQAGEEWVLTDGTHDLWMSPSMFDARSALSLEQGTPIASAAGSLTYSFGRHKLAPVSQGDVVPGDGLPDTGLPTDTGVDTGTSPVEPANPILMIAEYCDPSTTPANGRFLELYNPGPGVQDLSGYEIVRYANGATIATSTLSLSGTLGAGDTFVITKNEADMQSHWPGSTADLVSGTIDGNGDDTFVLSTIGGTVVDILGELGVDGSGEAWEYTDLCIVRDELVTAPSATWTSSEWFFTGTVHGSPNSHPVSPPDTADSGVIPGDTGPTGSVPEDTAPTGTPPGDTAPTGTLPTDTGTSPATGDTAAAGDLVISQYCDPSTTPSNGKYIELYNAGSASVDLSDYKITRYSNGTTNGQSISLSGTLSAGSTWVIANNLTDFQTHWPSITPDQNDGIVNGNGDDTFVLEDASTGDTVDIIGEIGVDGTGELWEYTDSCITRDSTVLLASDTWTDSEWTITAGLVDADPGSHP